MDTKPPISEPEPKPGPKVTRVLFKPGTSIPRTSFESMVDRLVKLRWSCGWKKAGKQGKEPPKPK